MTSSSDLTAPEHTASSMGLLMPRPPFRRLEVMGVSFPPTTAARLDSFSSGGHTRTASPYVSIPARPARPAICLYLVGESSSLLLPPPAAPDDEVFWPHT